MYILISDNCYKSDVCRSLLVNEVIWKSLGDSNLIDSTSKKTYKKTYHMLKCEIWKESYGSRSLFMLLRSSLGHKGVIYRSGSQKISRAQFSSMQGWGAGNFFLGSGTGSSFFCRLRLLIFFSTGSGSSFF